MGSSQNKPLISENAVGFRWWFVFSESEKPIIKRFLKKDRSHVYAFCEMGNICLMIEPHLGCVNHIVTECKALDLIQAAKDEGYSVVCKIMYPVPHKFIHRGFSITCASYLAYTVGISSFVFTPHQLYKKLISCGADEI